jgi:hypothetical protein
MYLEKNIASDISRKEALRYQPSFDLRKKIAAVISHYSIAAISKGITLDIYLDHETPNYFHGNANCFLEMLSQLLKLSIASLNEGEISIRIHHESIHQSNNCQTELTICIITDSLVESKVYSGTFNKSQPNTTAYNKFPLANCSTLHRIRNLSSFFAGKLSVKTLDECRTKFLLKCFLQQAHSIGSLHLA